MSCHWIAGVSLFMNRRINDRFPSKSLTKLPVTTHIFSCNSALFSFKINNMTQSVACSTNSHTFQITDACVNMKCFWKYKNPCYKLRYHRDLLLRPPNSLTASNFLLISTWDGQRRMTEHIHSWFHSLSVWVQIYLSISRRLLKRFVKLSC